MAAEVCPFSIIEKEKGSFTIGEKIQKIRKLKHSLEDYHHLQAEASKIKKSNSQSFRRRWHCREELYRNWRSAILKHWCQTDPTRFSIRRFAVASEQPLVLSAEVARVFKSASENNLREGQMILFGPVDWSTCYRKYYYIPNEFGILSLIPWRLNETNDLICNYYLSLGLTMGDLEILQEYKSK